MVSYWQKYVHVKYVQDYISVYSVGSVQEQCGTVIQWEEHGWVHGFPESVKSFITFVILSQILCGKVQKPLIFFAQNCVKVSPEFAVVSKFTSNN